MLSLQVVRSHEADGSVDRSRSPDGRGHYRSGVDPPRADLDRLTATSTLIRRPDRDHARPHVPRWAWAHRPKHCAPPPSWRTRSWIVDLRGAALASRSSSDQSVG